MAFVDDKARVEITAFQQVIDLGAPLIELGNVGGSEVDIDRYLAGEPECMVDYASPQGKVRMVDVVVNTAFSSFVREETIIERGAAICAAACSIWPAFSATLPPDPAETPLDRTRRSR